MARNVHTPVDLFKPYQRAVYDDPARFIAWIAGRQIGKSFTGAGRAVSRAMARSKTDVLVASPSERQSFEAILKCRDWAKAFEFAIADVLEERDQPGALMSSATIRFANGSRIIAVPGKPDTVRGFSADVWMDEFAFFEDPAATWKAILPSISNPLKGLKTAFITSTPNGKSGRGRRFWSIVTKNGSIDPARPPADLGTPNRYAADPWSVHRTPLADAAKFLGTNVEDLRRAVDDEEAWAQEFCCEFIDSANVLLPYDLIATCESADAHLTGFSPAEARGRFFAGVDFGRTSDPTVCWILEKVGDVLRTVEVLTLKNVSTPRQIEAIAPRLAACSRACLDYTGPGVGFGDAMAEKFGPYAPQHHRFGKVELCTFTLPFKRAIFPALRLAFEKRTVRVPMDVEVREDLHEMQQVVTNGEYNYTARRTAEGHSDRCTALALAIRAASFGGGDQEPFTVGHQLKQDMRRL